MGENIRKDYKKKEQAIMQSGPDPLKRNVDVVSVNIFKYQILALQTEKQMSQRRFEAQQFPYCSGDT